MAIIGGKSRSLIGPTKKGVANGQEGSPCGSGGAPKDHKKRRFPSSLFKRGRHTTTSTLLDSQQTSTESNTSPAVSDQTADDDKTKDCAFDQSCISSNTSSAPSLAPFEDGLFDSLEESILAVSPAYLDTYDTDAGSDAIGKGSPDDAQLGKSNAASDGLTFNANNALNNVELYEQSNLSVSPQDTVSSEPAQDLLRAHCGDDAARSGDCALTDDDILSDSESFADSPSSKLQRQNNGVVVHSSPHSRSFDPPPPSGQNSRKTLGVPSSPSSSSSSHLIGTPEAGEIQSPHMAESATGVEFTSSPNADTALTAAKDGLIKTLRRELGMVKEQKDTLEAENQTKDGLIQQLELHKQQLDEEMEGSYQDYWHLQLSHDRESESLAIEKKRVQQVKSEMALRNEFISSLSSQVQVLQQQKSTKETEIKGLQVKISVLEGQNTAHKEQSDAMQESLDHCRDALRTKDERITELEAKVVELVAGSTTKDDKINELLQQQASVVKESALIHEQAEKLTGAWEQNHGLKAENTQLRQLNTELETTDGYHQQYIDDLTGQKRLLSTHVESQHGTIASLVKLDGQRQYEIKDLYHGYACLCVKARNEPVSKDVFRATSHARYEEDHPVDGPCQDSSAPTILSPRPVRRNPPTWVLNESFEQLGLD